MKWVFYVVVFIYMFYRAVYGAKITQTGLLVEEINYGDDGFLKAGTQKIVNCRATNRNQKVQWVDPFGKVVKRGPGGRIFAQEHFVPSPRGGRTPALVLSLTKLLVSDSGIYQCRSGDLQQNVSLCVIEPSEFINTPTAVSADVGRSITLTCQAKGKPEPRLTWTRNGETLTDDDSSSKYRVMTKYNSQGFEGLLTIISLEPEDSGLYSCDAIQEISMIDDCSHIKNTNISLQINYGPIFVEGNRTKLVYGKNNQEVDLICSANGYPAPTYKWFKDVNDETILEFDKKYTTFSKEGNQAVLTITAGPTTYGQTFKCQATNQHGAAESVFTLLKMEKPIKPDELNQYHSTDEKIELNIKWNDEILFPVEGFDIQYVKMTQNESKKKIMTPREAEWRKSDLFEATVDSGNGGFGDFLVTLPDLEQETEYWIRVRATNNAGESPWSDSILASTTEVEEEQVTVVEEQTEETAMITDGNDSDRAFYGIFFTGGIIVVAIACMFAMRLV